MDRDTKFIIKKVVIDFVILLVVGFPILFFYLWGTPYKRGFFCDDLSLRHPFHESTIANHWLYIVGLGLPITVILITELVRSHVLPSQKSYQLFGYTIPSWVWESYCAIGIFGFGAACSQLSTDIAKYSIGRLRPHFYAVCNPNVNCTDPAFKYKYIEQFECQNTNQKRIKDMRLSFPSGHSSFSAYTMLYLVFYLQARLGWSGSKLLRHILQYTALMLAFYTALSRVSDYKHHWSDVLSGSFLGSLVAIIVAKYVSDLFPQKTINYLPTADIDTELTSRNASNGSTRNV